MTTDANPQAATTTEGLTSSDPAANPATGAGEGGQQQTPGNGDGGRPAGNNPPADGQTNGQQPDGKTGDNKGTDPKPDDKKGEGAPEAYNFTPPEGEVLHEAVVTQFSEVAKELNLTQEQAQKIIDKMAPAITANQNAAYATVREGWAQETATDSEFGGENLAENLAVAKKALDTFGTPELKQLLNDTGLGNHKEVIRVFFRAGKLISEDSFVGGNGGNPDQATAQRLYSASKMNP